MNNVMYSEKMKLKRTFITPVTLIYPFGIVMLSFLLILMQKNNFMERNYNMWDAMVVMTQFVIMFLIPLAITIISSNLINVEHQTNSWKFLFALPVGKSQFYFSKLLYLLKLCFFSALIIFIGFILIGKTLGFSGGVPYLLLLKAAFLPYLGSFPIITFQLWMSIQFKNQAFPIGIGILGAISTFFLQMNESTSYLFWAYPAMMTPVKLLLVNGSLGDIVTNDGLVLYTTLSFVFSLLFLLIGLIKFNKQQID
ncbi:ABC transporter permease [Priestia megaterium]|uniref:ABC transporter permease n=1 Tax=Priestia megaterium TaxID=1404 RepID=UPI001A941DD5|nr:ABC transporter permease [Priestia megaterium]QSX24446.1 ABC transporter permease [Priestia megaterium]